MNKLYSSLSLANWLLKHGITRNNGRNNDAEQSWYSYGDQRRN